MDEPTTTVGDLEGAVSRSVSLGDGRSIVVHLTDEGVIFDLYGEGDSLTTVGMVYEEWAEFVDRTAL